MYKTVSDPRNTIYDAKDIDITYASSLDLNVGYYHIKLSPGAKHLCTILIPWEGGYEYHKLPVGGCEIPDIFQVNISELFEVFYMVRKYIDNVLAINKN